MPDTHMTAPRDGRVLLDAISDHREAIRCAAGKLRRLADALAVIGNEKVADDLDGVAGMLTGSFKALDKAYSEDLSGQVRDAEAFTGTMLKAVLAGVIGPKAEG